VLVLLLCRPLVLLILLVIHVFSVVKLKTHFEKQGLDEFYFQFFIEEVMEDMSYFIANIFLHGVCSCC
jgi:hypothetical protein